MTKWIPVSEGLPKHEEPCLATVEVEGKRYTTNSIVCFYEEQTFGSNWWFKEWASPCRAEVLAWMPLPEPYEGE